MKPRDVSASSHDISSLIGMAKGPKRREWGTIGDLEILVDSHRTVVPIRRPRFCLRMGDKSFPFLRNVEKAQAMARLADYVEEAGGPAPARSS
jgi:hypothetical protein